MRELTLITTWKCSASCGHCFANCSPDRTEKLPLDAAVSCIDDFADFCPGGVLSLSGGEAFLFPEELESLIAYAHKRGCLCAAVTNGFWATSPTETEKRLRQLQLMGLDQLQLSMDDYHAAFIPLENDRNIITACAGCSLSLVIKMVTSPEASLRKHTLFSLLGEELRSLCPPERVMIQESPLVPAGRAARMEIPSGRLLDVPCTAVGFSGAVTPDGGFYACCGCGGLSDCGEKTAVYMGSIYENGLLPLLHGLDRALLIQLLRAIGPMKILLLSKELDKSIQIRSSYGSICQVCADLWREENRDGICALLDALRKPDFVKQETTV